MCSHRPILRRLVLTKGVRLDKYESRMTTFWIVYEVLLTGLMLGAVATWYIYSMQLVQDNAYKTRCAFEGQ